MHLPPADNRSPEQKADDDAFGLQLYEQRGFLVRFAGRMRSTQEERKELADETIMRAWKYRHLYRAEAKLGTWLCGIMKNVDIRDFNSGKKRSDVISLEMEDGRPLPIPVAPTQHRQAELHEKMDLLQAGTQTIPPIQRQVVAMTLAGMSYEEIAADLKRSVGTIKSDRSRAQASLADYYRRHTQPAQTSSPSQ